MITLRNHHGTVVRCDEDAWAVALTIARDNGWSPMDRLAREVSDDDAEALADAIDDGGDDMASLIKYCRRGGFRIYSTN